MEMMKGQVSEEKKEKVISVDGKSDCDVIISLLREAKGKEILKNHIWINASTGYGMTSKITKTPPESPSRKNELRDVSG